jgi:thiol-disulfide isomerase/thioredoxin
MKKIFTTLLVLFIAKMTFAQAYTINVQAKGYKGGLTYFTYYSGSNLNIQDSAIMKKDGSVVFSGKTKLLGGIYVLVLPDRRRVDFLIDKEQKITIKLDSTDLVFKTVITGSKENILYQQYQKTVTTKGRLRDAERKAYSESTTKADSILHEKNFNTFSNDMSIYREGIIKNQPNSMMAMLLLAMKDAPVLMQNPKTKEDSAANFYHYKKHYWDGITFMDDRVIRTPFFTPKLQRFYTDVEINADSIIKDIDYKLLLARSSPELYKYLLNWFTDFYLNPKYMGQDAVLVHLFNNYHSKGASYWLNDKQMEFISRRAYMLMSNLIGEQAANLEMLNTEDKPTSLYNVNADFTVVCFWDPNCGHCKTEVPRVDSIYRASWKNKGVKIFAVLTPENEANVKTEWLKFIAENKIADWNHAYQTKAMVEADNVAQKPSFRQLYDVTSTPILYLLDKDKHIIGKKLTILQMNELLEAKLKNTKTN